MLKLVLCFSTSALLLALTGCEGVVVGEGEGEGEEGEGEEGEGEEGEGEEGEGEGEEGEGEGEGEEGEGEDAPGWTTLLALDGDVDFHNNDNITSIYFASIDDGYIGTDGPDSSVVYKATRGAMTSFAIDEDVLTDPPGGLGDFAVRSIQETSLGITVALDTSGALLTSDDDFATFDLFDSGLDYGISPLEGLHEDADGNWVALVGSGVVATATDAPGAGVVWTETWAPEGIPTTPNPIPAEGCVYGPRTRQTENIYNVGAFTPDGNTVVYITRSVDISANDETVVCVSNDGGVTFEPRVLPVPADGPSEIGPTAVVMTSNTTGFVATSDFSAGEGGTTTIWKTANAGDTWAPVDIPGAAETDILQISTLFFAPGGTVGYAGGQNNSSDRPILWRTNDGGDTWTDVTAINGLAAAMDAAGTFGRIFTGFAIDADHFWVGGDHGAVFYNSTGGQ